MTYKILSTRTTPDGVLFVTAEYNIDGNISSAEIAIHMPTEQQQIIDAIVNYAKNEKWKTDAIAKIPTLVSSLTLNQEVTIE